MGAAIAFVLAQLVLAWQQQPFTVTKRQLAQLDRLFRGPSRCTGRT
jgi:hypothetical protein